MTIQRGTQFSFYHIGEAIGVGGMGEVYRATDTNLKRDVAIKVLTGERTERPLLATEFNEINAALSPDGRWLAYQSDETGRLEIYVRPFPEVEDGKWQVSTGGGEEPHWRGDGKELFYRQAGTPVTLVAVPVETERRFASGIPAQLFSGNYSFDPPGRSYDVTADGQRFLMMQAVEETRDDVESQLTSLVVVENWFEELKRLAPPAN